MDSSILRFLKTKEAAKYLSLSPSFLAKKRLTGDGPVFCKMGRCVAYSLEALDEFAAISKRRSTSEPASPLVQLELPRKRRHSHDTARER